VSKAIETAQKRVEMYNFDIRKHLLEYDNVMNKQREVIYDERRKILEGDDAYIKAHICEITEEVLDSGLDFYLNENAQQQEGGWDFDGLTKWLQRKFGTKMALGTFGDRFIPDSTQEHKLAPVDREGIREQLISEITKIYSEKEQQLGPENMRHLERFIMLQVMDTRWKDHLYAMDGLREGIGLRAYGQKDPLVEYQHEGYDMFMQMIDSIKEEVVEFVYRVQAVHAEKAKSVFASLPQTFEHPDAQRPRYPEAQIPRGPDTQVSGPCNWEIGELGNQELPSQCRRDTPKVGRNDPCPCGSGKKFKKCCGANK
jgi:preprotein translocase subunit SecA